MIASIGFWVCHLPRPIAKAKNDSKSKLRTPNVGKEVAIASSQLTNQDSRIQPLGLKEGDIRAARYVDLTSLEEAISQTKEMIWDVEVLLITLAWVNCFRV